MDEDRALDQVIGGWFDQVETYFLDAAGLPPSPLRERHCGRTKGPRVVWKQALKDKTRGLSWQCPQARWWSSLAAEVTLHCSLR